MDRWVINASPLICLAKAGYLDLILNLPDEVVVPSAVVEEIRAGQAGDLAQLALAGRKFPISEMPALPEFLPGI